jgi:hypothetical protein
MIEPFKTTSIIIDDPNVTITKSFDGDMVFRDKFVPGIKLKEIISMVTSGGTFVFDPAVMMLIEETDYTYIASEDLYAVDIPHNFGFSGTDKNGVVVAVYDSDYTQIGVDTVKLKDNSVYIKVSSPDIICVVIKRVI